MDMKAREAKKEPDIFWGEIAPCDHLVQIYEDDATFLDTLVSFVMAGLRTGESVIVIATAAHLTGLENRLGAEGLNTSSLRLAGQYLPFDAKETLSKFMVNGWPDEKLFRQTVAELLARARRHGGKVRAFGEMVALLWAEGYNGATVRLEHLWNDFCQTELFCLFCAYPRAGFTKNVNESIKEICATHSKVVAG
jgi:MEDS: MEthanogen/methylotroph, DcmR Sensory domain